MKKLLMAVGVGFAGTLIPLSSASAMSNGSYDMESTYKKQFSSMSHDKEFDYMKYRDCYDKYQKWHDKKDHDGKRLTYGEWFKQHGEMCKQSKQGYDHDTYYDECYGKHKKDNKPKKDSHDSKDTSYGHDKDKWDDDKKHDNKYASYKDVKHDKDYDKKDSPKPMHHDNKDNDKKDDKKSYDDKDKKYEYKEDQEKHASSTEHKPTVAMANHTMNSSSSYKPAKESYPQENKEVKKKDDHSYAKETKSEHAQYASVAKSYSKPVEMKKAVEKTKYDHKTAQYDYKTNHKDNEHKYTEKKDQTKDQDCDKKDETKSTRDHAEVAYSHAH